MMCPQTGLRIALLAALIPGALSAQQPLAFDAASIKSSPPQPMGTLPGGGGTGAITYGPGKVSCRGVTVRRLILDSYHLHAQQLARAPDWLDTDRFDIEAKSAGPVTAPDLDQMLQTLLADRFQLVVRQSTRQMPVYALIAPKGEFHVPTTFSRPPDVHIVGTIQQRGTIAALAQTLSRSADRPVIDKTGLSGTYGFFITRYSGEDWTASIEDRTGLKVQSQKAELPYMVIERIAKPSAN